MRILRSRALCTILILLILTYLASLAHAAITSSSTGGLGVNLTKIENRDPVNSSSFLNYTITINVTIVNSSVTNLSNLTLIETYPPQVIFQSGQPTPLTGTNNTFVLGNFTANASVVVNITVFTNNLTNGTVINNTANITYQNRSSVQLNLSVTEGTTVLAPPVLTNFSNLSITKTDTPDPVDDGSQITYTITVTSSGNGTAYNVTVNDTYPAGVVFNSGQPAPLAGTNNTFVLGNLTNGSSVVVNITVNVSTGLGDGTVLTNNATASFQNDTSQVFQNVTASTTTTVANPPPGGTGGSGGGGGGGVSTTRTMNTDTATYTLRRNERVMFRVNDVQHLITIINVYEDRVHLRVASHPQEFTINDGASNTVDVNHDTKNDIRITVLDTNYARATLKIELLKECIESWTCDAWSECVGGTQTRDCTDAKGCGTTKLKPKTSQSCEVKAPEPAPAPPEPAAAQPEPAKAQPEREGLPLSAMPPVPMPAMTIENIFYGLVLLALVILIGYWYAQQRKKRSK